MFSWTHSAIEVRDTGRHGKGNFAKEKLFKDELLVVLGGHIIDRNDELLLPEKLRDNACQISPILVIGALTEVELDTASYLNHSCEPNAGFKGQIFLVAMRDIDVNEEITFDYGMVLYDDPHASRGGYVLTCLCGTASCRRTITGNDWKLPRLQQKYDGYFQYYLAEKILQMNQRDER